MRKVIGFFSRLIPSSKYARAVGVLAGGTAFSQLLMVAALPILTRLYSPEDFGVLAVYASVLALISVVSCLRLEIAIPIPKERSQAIDLLFLSLLSALLVTTLSFAVVVCFADQIHGLTHGQLKGYLWLIPAGVLLSGFYTAFQYWSTREKQYSLISKTRMTQATSGVTAQLGLGYLGITPLGLLIGHALSVGFGVWGLAAGYVKNNRQADISLKSLKSTFKEYDRFPKYATWEALSNSAAIQVPVLIIASYAAGPEVGFLMLAIKLLSAPIGLIGRSVAQVYLSEAPVFFQKGQLKNFTKKTVWTLAKVGAPPLLLAGLLSPFVVPLFFGAEWERTGILIAWMVPWFYMQFISSPVSMSLHITGSQYVAFLLQALGFIFRSGAVLLAGVFFDSYLIEVYAVTGFVFYGIYLSVIYLILRRAEK